jgi:hypothetical protein
VKRSSILKLAIVACILVYVYVIFQLVAKNLVVDTDYPYHAHSIWAASKGFLLKDPFLVGGSHLTLSYGAPVILVGAVICPLLGAYTVAVLLAAAVPVLWYFSGKMFSRLASADVAKLAAIIVLLNPLTVYYFLTAKLPFIWAMCFGVASVYFYLEKRNLLAMSLGGLAVITHPLSIFLFAALLLMGHNFRQWIKYYFIAGGIFAVQLAFIFKFNPIGGVSTFSIVNILILAFALLAVFWVKKETRILSATALAFLACWCIGGLFGLSMPSAYFDRLGFLVLLLLAPLLIVKLGGISLRKPLLSVPVFLVLTAGVGYARVTIETDNPATYREMPEGLVTTLQQGYVHYACDGSALYELPKLGIRLSNEGRHVSEAAPENAEVYAAQIDAENASYILVYRISSVENAIQELGYPLIYSEDNVKIYQTHLAPENLS